jgi:hypothetical protein
VGDIGGGPEEAAALLRIANTITRELEVIADPHWRTALVTVRDRLSASAQRMGAASPALVGDDQDGAA